MTSNDGRPTSPSAGSTTLVVQPPLFVVDHVDVRQWTDADVGPMVQVTNNRTGMTITFTSDQWHRFVVTAAISEGVYDGLESVS